MTDIWVCGDCKSVNPMRSGRCYKCRAPRPPAGEEMAAAAASALEAEPAPPRVIKTLDPERVAASGFGQPTPRPERIRPEVSPSAAAAINPTARLSTVPAAVLGIALLIGVLGLRLLLTRSSIASLEGLLAVGEPPPEEATLVGALGIVFPLLGVLAIAGLGFWAYRVMTNVPLLGGGWPRFTPGQAFLEHVIPGWNVLRTPGVYRDIQTRLSEDGGANDLLLVGWVLINIAAVVVVRPIGSTLASFGVTVEDQIAIIAVANYASIGLQGLAILMIAALILEIEGQQSARVRSLLADNAPPPPVDEAVVAAHEVVVAPNGSYV
ncbi:MAG: DUF4328 domain-containing protein [Chloroflexi bacterium]|nr:DUF4328 domain-containing protein [Chloroflexota bacterium]